MYFEDFYLYKLKDKKTGNTRVKGISHMLKAPDGLYDLA